MAFSLIVLRIRNTDLLVFQRRDNKAPTDPGLLGLFGGSIEEGELPLDAAYRELREETSLNVRKDELRFITKTFMPTPAGQTDVYLYTLDIDDSPFDVFEGSGYERHTRTAFIERDDASIRAVDILRVNNV